MQFVPKPDWVRLAGPSRLPTLCCQGQEHGVGPEEGLCGRSPCFFPRRDVLRVLCVVGHLFGKKAFLSARSDPFEATLSRCDVALQRLVPSEPSRQNDPLSTTVKGISDVSIHTLLQQRGTYGIGGPVSDRIVERHGAV